MVKFLVFEMRSERCCIGCRQWVVSFFLNRDWALSPSLPFYTRAIAKKDIFFEYKRAKSVSRYSPEPKVGWKVQVCDSLIKLSTQLAKVFLDFLLTVWYEFERNTWLQFGLKAFWWKRPFVENWFKRKLRVFFKTNYCWLKTEIF